MIAGILIGSHFHSELFEIIQIDKSDTGEYVMVDQVSYNETTKGEMKEVFSNGVLKIDQSLSEIRNRLN